MLGLKRRLETSHVIAFFDLPAFEQPIDKCILSRQFISISNPSTSHHLHQAASSTPSILFQPNNYSHHTSHITTHHIFSPSTT
jgi:hypothetical protein